MRYVVDFSLKAVSLVASIRFKVESEIPFCFPDLLSTVETVLTEASILVIVVLALVEERGTLFLGELRCGGCGGGAVTEVFKLRTCIKIST